MRASGLFVDGLPGSEKYDIEKEIGHGTFSEVHQAKNKSTGELVALKNIHLNEDGIIPIHVSREIEVLQRLQGHPHIITLKEMCQQAFSISLILQHCRTDLYSILHHPLHPRPLPLPLIKTTMYQLLQALDALHSAGYIHRDVSPSNILFDHDGNLRLSDFGQSRSIISTIHNNSIDDNNDNNNTNTATIPQLTPTVGTRWYKSPELLFASRTYTTTTDMWSVGCIFAELLTGTAIFPGRSDIDQLCRIRNALGSLTEEIWPGVVELPDWGKLIFPPLERKEWNEILSSCTGNSNNDSDNNSDSSIDNNNCYDNDIIELLDGLLQYNPEKRLSARDAMHAAFFTSLREEERENGGNSMNAMMLGYMNGLGISMV